MQDSICPYCYIGKRKLDRAIDIAKEKGLDVEVKREFHPYTLDPTLKPDSYVDLVIQFDVSVLIPAIILPSDSNYLSSYCQILVGAIYYRMQI